MTACIDKIMGGLLASEAFAVLYDDDESKALWRNVILDAVDSLEPLLDSAVSADGILKLRIALVRRGLESGLTRKIIERLAKHKNVPEGEIDSFVSLRLENSQNILDTYEALLPELSSYGRFWLLIALRRFVGLSLPTIALVAVGRLTLGQLLEKEPLATLFVVRKAAMELVKAD